MKFLKYFLVANVCALSAAFVACGNSESTSSNGLLAESSSSEKLVESSSSEEVEKSSSSKENEILDTLAKSKSVVVYFSRTGHTKEIANHIIELKNLESFEIQAAEPYTDADIDYNTECRANNEQNNATVRPDILETFTAIADYDTVYLGYPIWWGKAPRILFTFLEKHDMKNKVIFPFCTSASSPLGKSDAEMHDSAPEAIWQPGIRFAIGTSKTEVQKWLSK